MKLEDIRCEYVECEHSANGPVPIDNRPLPIEQRDTTKDGETMIFGDTMPVVQFVPPEWPLTRLFHQVVSRLNRGPQ
jgi:hypothetical protein